MSVYHITLLQTLILNYQIKICLELSSKISIDGQKLTYDKLMKAEVYKIVKFVQNNEKYKPFKYT